MLSEEELRGITTADLERVWLDRFGNAGDFVFMLSGDLDLDATIDLAARYLGTLPSTGEKETAAKVAAAPPAGVRQSTVHAGTGETASLTVQFTTAAADTNAIVLKAQLLTSVLNIRLTDAIREELGASYSPSASVSVVGKPENEATVNISISGSPDDMDEIARVLQDNLADLRANGPSAAEFEAAVAEAQDAYNFISDAQIITMIERWLVYPGSFDDYENQLNLISVITPASLRDFASQVLPADQYIEITQLPR